MKTRSSDAGCESLDDLVTSALFYEYPSHLVPDEGNQLPSGKQYKAPDHLILNGRIAIERKSRNVCDKSQLFEKLRRIAAKQGKSINGYGNIELGSIISDFPDPIRANWEITDFMLRGMMDSILCAKKQFFEYLANKPQNPPPICLLIISDQTTNPESTAHHEYFIGRKMGALNTNQDRTGVIDAIIFIKNPAYVCDQKDSFWFKCLIKHRVSLSNRQRIRRLSLMLQRRLGDHASIAVHIAKFRIGTYRPLIV